MVLGKKRKWLKDNITVFLGAAFILWLIVSLSFGSPDPRLWILGLVGRAPTSSSIITESEGRVVHPGGSNSPGGEEEPAGALFGVYSDYDCTTTLSSVNWGTLYPGDTETVVMYVKNTGNVPFTLDLSTAKWSSAEAEQHITLTWDYQAQELASNDLLKLVLRLEVSPSISGVTDFSFDIVVTASPT